MASTFVNISFLLLTSLQKIVATTLDLEFSSDKHTNNPGPLDPALHLHHYLSKDLIPCLVRYASSLSTLHCQTGPVLEAQHAELWNTVALSHLLEWAVLHPLYHAPFELRERLAAASAALAGVEGMRDASDDEADEDEDDEAGAIFGALYDELVADPSVYRDIEGFSQEEAWQLDFASGRLMDTLLGKASNCHLWAHAIEARLRELVGCGQGQALPLPRVIGERAKPAPADDSDEDMRSVSEVQEVGAGEGAASLHPLPSPPPSVGLPVISIRDMSPVVRSPSPSHAATGPFMSGALPPCSPPLGPVRDNFTPVSMVAGPQGGQEEGRKGSPAGSDGLDSLFEFEDDAGPADKKGRKGSPADSDGLDSLFEFEDDADPDAMDTSW